MARRTPQLNPSIRQEIAAYTGELRAARIPIRQIYLFGSRAKGTARKDSDIDLAVVSRTFGKDYHKDLIRLLRLRRGRWLRIEPHPFHPDDLNNRWSTLAAEIKKYGILVN